MYTLSCTVQTIRHGMKHTVAAVRDSGGVVAAACGWVSAGEDGSRNGRQRCAGLCSNRRAGTGRHAPC